MAKINYLEKLPEDTINGLNDLATTIMSNDLLSSVSEDGKSIRINTANLLGLIQLLEEQKKAAKEADAAHALEDKEIAKAKAAEEGAKIAKTVAVGDIVTFITGSGKNARQFTRKVEKFSDKTFTVEFTEDYPCTTSLNAPTGKKHIQFSKIVSVAKATAEVAA